LPISFIAQSFARPESKYAQYKIKPKDATMFDVPVSEAGKDLVPVVTA
jgi:hypothetical protein